MKTPLQEMYEDVMGNRQQSLDFYLKLERNQMLVFALELGVTLENAENHFRNKYENKEPQTTTIRPDIS